MRIKRRELLLILLVASQFGCIALGLVWGASWLHKWLAQSFELRALAEAHATTQQVAVRLTRDGTKNFEPGTAGWEQLQSLCERTTVPYDGHLWALRRDTGALVCHPNLREDPSLLRHSLGRLPIVASGRAPTLLEAINDAEANDEEIASGTIIVDGALQLASAVSLPGANTVLLVLQPYTHIAQAATDFIAPLEQIGWIFSFGVVGATTVLTVVLINRYEDTLAQSNADLERKVQRRTQSLLSTRNAVIFALAKLAESRDKDTGEHLGRIRSYVTILAGELARSHKEITHQYVAELAIASSLHDVGKVGIPDSVLLKPSRLTAAERRAMQLHTQLGAECLASIQKQLGDDDFLELAREIAYSHHEHWDGSGYPCGLQGRQIPLPARIVALADVYDALTSARPYKQPMSHAAAREWIASRYGSQFDPEVVEAFIGREAEFRRISEACFGSAEPEFDDSELTADSPANEEALAAIAAGI